jgi:hypothetical protein
MAIMGQKWARILLLVYVLLICRLVDAKDFECGNFEKMLMNDNKALEAAKEANE